MKKMFVFFLFFFDKNYVVFDLDSFILGGKFVYSTPLAVLRNHFEILLDVTGILKIFMRLFRS